MNDWYKNLKKAPWSPPSYVFGIVWPILYFLMFTAFINIWKDEKCYPYCSALNFFIIQLIFNLSWTTIFFRMRMPRLALLDLTATLFFTLVTYHKFSLINNYMSRLLLPYIGWLILAFSLNYYIVLMN